MTERVSSTFRLSYAVQIDIAAPPAAVWERLTRAADFPRWNTVVDSIEGEVALGGKLAIRVPSAPGRTFTPRVVVFEPERRMVWRDGFAPMFQGTRTFVLTPSGGGTSFEMIEVFQGLLLPLIRGSLPDMVPIFDRYAQDLKAVCEVL